MKEPPSRIARLHDRARPAVAFDSLSAADFTGADGKVRGDCPTVPGTVAGVTFAVVLPRGALLALTIERHSARFARCANCRKKNGVDDLSETIE
jgi:hypothetical protein